MSSLRSLLLLVIVAGLALFVLQNWTPVLPLVLLGVPTQPIPLAFWMMGAIAIGAITTIVIAALFRITAFTAAPRKRRPRGRSSIPPNAPPTNGRGIDPMDVTYTTSPRTTMQSDDDWEQADAAWDDWGEPTSAASRDRPIRDAVSERPDRPPVDFRIDDFRAADRSEESYRADDFTDRFRAEEREERQEEPFYPEASSEPPIYDAPYEVYRPAYRSLDEPDDYSPPYSEPSYSEPEYREPAYSEPEYAEPKYAEPFATQSEPEVWDDWEEAEAEPIAPPEPQRPIVEVQQTPKSEYRSGTVYSYSYRGDDATPTDRPADSAEPERVIVPPAPDEDEDWGFDDEADPRSTRSNRDRDR